MAEETLVTPHTSEVAIVSNVSEPETCEKQVIVPVPEPEPVKDVGVEDDKKVTSTESFTKETNVVVEEDLGSEKEKVVYIHGVDKEGHPLCYNAFAGLPMKKRGSNLSGGEFSFLKEVSGTLS